MAISESEIAQVRAATDIVALISETVALKRTGQRWTGLCPFHGEKTPSFSVNAEEGRYYCFGCRASGDQITWVRETQHLDFMDALRQLAERAGIELHEDAKAGPARKERQEAMAAMDRAVTWYHERLLGAPDARPAREYLRSRGIDGELARQFKLGWAPDEWDALSASLKLNEKVLSDNGARLREQARSSTGRPARASHLSDFRSERQGHRRGRASTSYHGTPRPDGRVEPKYKNSPETPIYSKRRTLYALNFAKDDIIKSGEIIVCEGYTDVIAFFSAGMPRAVATCGTALGEEHFRLMRNFAKRIVLAYDADSAGQSAAASVYQWESQHEVDVSVAKLPKGTDPADLAQRDPAALRESIAKAVPFLRFRLDRVLEGATLSTAEGRHVRRSERWTCSPNTPANWCATSTSKSSWVAWAWIRRCCALGYAKLPGTLASARCARSPTSRHARARRARRMPRPALEALRLHRPRSPSMKERFVAPYFLDEVQRDIYDALCTEQRRTQNSLTSSRGEAMTSRRAC